MNDLVDLLLEEEEEYYWTEMDYNYYYKKHHYKDIYNDMEWWYKYQLQDEELYEE